MIGVTLTTAIILALAAIVLELKVVYSSQWLRSLVRRGAFFGIAFSLMFSWFVGFIFGASGLIIMIAATIAAPVTETIHSIKRDASDKIRKVKSTTRELIQSWMWLFKTIKVLAIIVTAPIWIPMWIRRKRTARVGPEHYTTAA